MNWAVFSSILSAIGQLPPVAIIAVTCVFIGAGLGIGMILRDIPKYIYKTVVAILNFVLRLKGKEQIGSPPKQNEKKGSSKTEIFRIIEGGKSKKKENHHKDNRATESSQNA